MNTLVYIPPWLAPLLGHREREIIEHPEVRCLQVDQDGNRLPSHQQILESPCGSFWIDSQRKQIIG